MAATQKEENADNEVKTFTLTKEEFDSVKELIASKGEAEKKLKEQDGLIADLRRQVEQGNSATPSGKPGEPVKPGSVCRLHVYSDEELNEFFVVGWTKRGVYRDKHTEFGQTEVRDFIELMVMNADGKIEEKPIKMLYVDFMNLPQRNIKIKQKRALEPKIDDLGTREVMVRDQSTGLLQPSGRYVRDTVVSDRYEYVLDINGHEVVLDEKYIN